MVQIMFKSRVGAF